MMWYGLATCVSGTICFVVGSFTMRRILSRKVVRMRRAGEAMAEALEMVKTKHLIIWDDIKPIIENAVKPTSEIENAIRRFRKLEPRL